jgi:hypothetical protein
MTVYLPDELHEYVRSHGMNVSALLQRAIRREAQVEGMARLADELNDEGLVDEELVRRWLTVLGVEQPDPSTVNAKLASSRARRARTIAEKTKTPKVSKTTRTDSKSGRRVRTDA